MVIYVKAKKEAELKNTIIYSYRGNPNILDGIIEFLLQIYRGKL